MMFDAFSPITPPSEAAPNAVLASAQTVLRAQAATIAHITDLYDSDPEVQQQFAKGIQYLHNAVVSGNKVVLTGMGKSHKIACKLSATMNSLGMHATPLHPTEALHGDLGIVKPGDVVVMITASGNTPELKQLLPHLDATLLTLTCEPNSSLGHLSHAVFACPVPDTHKEKNIYGIAAPTTSTTACLVVGDSICIALCESLQLDKAERNRTFGRNHPGGVIGEAFKNELPPVQSVCSYSTSSHNEMLLLRTTSGNQWVVVDNTWLVPTRNILELIDAGFTEQMETQIRLEELEKVDQSRLAGVPPGQRVVVVKEDEIVGVYER
ncbi:Arabinose 5-phosphate isomerase KdsD [Yarrowia sp. C11]|nr:Arabinose 5-phosphate isomerase KdsD [Yarrowia sp. C11]